MKITSRLTITRDRSEDLLKNTKKLTAARVLVGIPEGSDRQDEDGKPAPNNALLGYINNYGSPSQNIPARPFMETGIRSREDKIVRHLRKAGEEALRGNTDGMMAQFESAGLTAQAGIQQKITEGPFVPLAPRTLAGRRKRGRTGEKPLMDTGQLRRSITFIVKS